MQSGFGVWPGGKAAGFCYYCLIIKKNGIKLMLSPEDVLELLR